MGSKEEKSKKLNLNKTEDQPVKRKQQIPTMSEELDRRSRDYNHLLDALTVAAILLTLVVVLDYIQKGGLQ